MSHAAGGEGRLACGVTQACLRFEVGGGTEEQKARSALGMCPETWLRDGF